MAKLLLFAAAMSIATLSTTSYSQVVNTNTKEYQWICSANPLPKSVPTNIAPLLCYDANGVDLEAGTCICPAGIAKRRNVGCVELEVDGNGDIVNVSAASDAQCATNIQSVLEPQENFAVKDPKTCAASCNDTTTDDDNVDNKPQKRTRKISEKTEVEIHDVASKNTIILIGDRDEDEDRKKAAAANAIKAAQDQQSQPQQPVVTTNNTQPIITNQTTTQLPDPIRAGVDFNALFGQVAGGVNATTVNLNLGPGNGGIIQSRQDLVGDLTRGGL